MSSSVVSITNKSPIPTLKVVLLGDSGVGKTCLRSQFVHHIFTNAYKATIGGDYLTTTVTMPDVTPVNTAVRQVEHEHEVDLHSSSNADKPNKVNLQIWDTAGQERFNSISQAFYRGTDVVILVYDITNYESVLSIRDWFKRFLEHCHVDKPGVMIVGNKIDRSSERCVELNEIREILTSNVGVSVESYIDDWNVDLREVSSKRLDLVEELFIRAAQLGIDLTNGENLNDNSNANKRRNILGFDSIDLNDDQKHVAPGCSC